MLRIARALAAVLAVAAVAAPVGHAAIRPFADSSFWNQPLAPTAPLDAKSAIYVAELQRQLLTARPWINTTEHSTPVYTVGPEPKSKQVTLLKLALDDQSRALADAWEQVPMPDDALPAAGVDRTLVVHQPATDTLWEFWNLQHVGSAWYAEWGGKITGVSTHPGYYTSPTNRWGATATSLPILGGLIRIDELRAGRIDHALALSIPDIRAQFYSWPAQRTDGQMHGENAIPAGTRFRLPPTLDLWKMPMSPVVRQIALAVQKYGMVVRDRSHSVAFYAEDPTPTGTNPYEGEDGFFGGSRPSTLLQQFPWGRLQALRTRLSVDPH
jgi:hypothetical protein